ncbi:hypothetical protein ABFS83_11G023800 [Erythranthe nasuta]
MATERWLLLGKLRRAVNKIKFLLDFNVSRWKLASIVGAISSNSRRLSFNDKPGLMAFVEDSGPENSPGLSKGLQRSTSYQLENNQDDYNIDERADAFIANFYKQLQLERQISLELRYYRGNSFDSSKLSP